MRTLHIGLESWIIQDGNYADFRAGQEARFALQFGRTPSQVDGGVAPSLRHQEGAVHIASGRIVFAAPEAWVCDFGVLAYGAEHSPPWAAVGSHVAGGIYLGIDPFDYFERLQHLPGMPNLFYTCTIRRILLETTPWVQEVDASGRYFRRREAVSRTFREIQTTNAWEDDDQAAGYVLECEHFEQAV